MSEHKDTNPKDAVGIAKVPFSTVSMPVMAELGLVMMEGARKYGRHNYRAVGVRASVYVDAALRHIARFWEGEDIDPDSGMPHLVHAMACCTVLRDSQIQGNWTDDRPPVTPQGWIEKMNAHAKSLIERYPNPVAPYTQLGTETNDSVLSDAERRLELIQSLVKGVGRVRDPALSANNGMDMLADAVQRIIDGELPAHHSDPNEATMIVELNQ